MENEENFEKALRRVVRSDPRYPIEAYYFIYEALDYTQKLLVRRGHLSGQELSQGIRRYALEQFGLMARTVFESWGIHETDDFGELVFNLVENNLLKKTDQDSRKDFHGLFDFEEAFDQSFEIASSSDET